MDYATCNILSRLTSEFYAQNHDSFARTRQNAWPGWNRCIKSIKPDALRQLSVLDVACGNARFAAFLEQQLGQPPRPYYAVDNCADLVPKRYASCFYPCDIIKSLLNQNFEEDLAIFPSCKMVVSFGFMHHIPSQELRIRFLNNLAAKLDKAGYLAVSFWRFADDESLKAKAEISTQSACKVYALSGLEPGDYLVGWQDCHETYRYCHSFSDGEISEYVKTLSESFNLIDRFRSDGRTGDLNEYLLFRR